MATAASPSSTPLGIENWLRSAGVWWDTSLMRIQGGCSGCSGPALGVFAVTDVQENQLLCVIPRSAILSPRTTQLAGILEAEKLGGGLALTIAVMYEASLGATSKWAGYIQSLPKREYSPLFWSDKELALLQGTALEGCAQDDRRDTQEDYNNHVVPLMARHAESFPHPELCSLSHFRIAASWVASRCFYVDSWHGDAMVPLADIFNHKASLVLLDDAWKVAEELDAQQQEDNVENTHQGSEVDDDHDDASEQEEQDICNSQQQADEVHDDNEQDGKKVGEGEQESQEEEEVIEEESENEEDDEDDDDDDEESDPQYGFAVGGMPVITAGTAGVANHKAAASWMRDGVNLRLEIGICSLGPSDNIPLAATESEEQDEVTADKSYEADERSSKCHSHDNGDCDDHDCQHHRKRQRTEQQQLQPPLQQQHPEKRLEIIAASPVTARAEIHNTYGELDNAQLLHKYGFCLPQNPFDEVQLGPTWDWLLLEVAGLDKRKEMTAYLQWLQKNRVLTQQQQQQQQQQESEVHAEDDTADPPAVSPCGRLPLVTAAVLRVLAATPETLEQWSSLEDVIEEMKQPADTAAAAAVEDLDAHSALSGHFEDIPITDRDVTYWGNLGLEILISGIAEKLQRYPALTADAQVQQRWQQRKAAATQQQGSRKSQVVVQDCLDLITIDKDERLLQKSHEGQQRQQQEQNDHCAAEHVAAVSAALQLRVCEQRILQQAVLAIQQLLSVARVRTAL